MKKIIVFAIFASSLAIAQDEHSQKGMDMSSHDMSNIPGMASDGSASAMKAMEGHHMGMGAHMKMTELRDAKPDDKKRADEVVKAARKVSEKYMDYQAALADGFQIFHPELPQKQYHFTNYRYAFEAAMHFDPEHPTSLLYEKNRDGYKLIGVMYTDRKNATEDELDSRIPLSVAQWHAHINLCLPPSDQKGNVAIRDAKFGLGGSIATKEACDAAGGKFMPQIFGWMVHVYPFEQKPEDIWSVEKQMHAD